MFGISDWCYERLQPQMLTKIENTSIGGRHLKLISQFLAINLEIALLKLLLMVIECN